MLLKFGLLIISLALLCTIVLFFTDNEQLQKRLFVSLAIDDRTRCSLDRIDVCQSYGPGTRGTFLYIMWGGVGFGSELNQLLLAFAYSMASRRQFFVDCRGWNYGDFHDYFNLQTQDFNRSLKYEFIVANGNINEQRQHLKTTRTGPQVGEFWRATRGVQTIASKRKVGQYLWQRLSKNFSALMKQCPSDNRTKYVAVHVRRGDKLRSEARATSASTYVDRIEKIMWKKQIPPVFVASDDEFVIEDFRKIRPQWIFLSFSHMKSNGSRQSGHQQATFNRLSADAKRREAVFLMCELQMLIKADMVFCGMTSNICRLVQILRHQPTPSVISMDRGWYGT